MKYVVCNFEGIADSPSCVLQNVYPASVQAGTVIFVVQSVRVRHGTHRCIALSVFRNIF